MTTIYAPMTPKIVHVIDFIDDLRRYRWTRTALTKTNGDVHIHDEYVEVPDEGPLLFIPGGVDVDDVAVHDLTQMAKGKPPKVREDKPDVQAMYRHFNEVRRWELDNKRLFPVAKVED